MTNRISLASLCLAVALLSSGPEALSAQEVGLRLEDPSEILLQGNDHYQEGRFQEALSAFESILESGFESPDLYYNLGNAYFKMGDLGGSILNFVPIQSFPCLQLRKCTISIGQSTIPLQTLYPRQVPLIGSGVLNMLNASSKSFMIHFGLEIWEERFGGQGIRYATIPILGINHSIKMH